MKGGQQHPPSTRITNDCVHWGESNNPPISSSLRLCSGSCHQLCCSLQLPVLVGPYILLLAMFLGTSFSLASTPASYFPQSSSTGFLTHFPLNIDSLSSDFVQAHCVSVPIVTQFPCPWYNIILNCKQNFGMASEMKEQYHVAVMLHVPTPNPLSCHHYHLISHIWFPFPSFSYNSFKLISSQCKCPTQHLNFCKLHIPCHVLIWYGIKILTWLLQSRSNTMLLWC